MINHCIIFTLGGHLEATKEKRPMDIKKVLEKAVFPCLI